MPATTEPHRRPFSIIDRGILILHSVVAGGIGIVAFIGASDPDFGDLQRIVIVMLIGLWGLGIFAIGFFARLVSKVWARIVLLLAGPFIGIAFVFGRSMLGIG